MNEVDDQQDKKRNNRRPSQIQVCCGWETLGENPSINVVATPSTVTSGGTKVGDFTDLSASQVGCATDSKGYIYTVSPSKDQRDGVIGQISQWVNRRIKGRR